MLFRKYSMPFVLCLVLILVSALLAQEPEVPVLAPLPAPNCDNKCRLKTYFIEVQSGECRKMVETDCFLCVGPNGLDTLCRNDTPSPVNSICVPNPLVPQSYFLCTNCVKRCGNAKLWSESKAGDPMGGQVPNGVRYSCEVP